MAGRASLAFIGPEEISLSGQPEVSYFIEKFKGQTLFSSRVEKVSFYENGANFGTQRQLILPRSGDLITDMYLWVQFPALPPTTNVLDSAGTLMFQYIELYIGSELVERLWGEYIEMKFDMEIPAAKQYGLKALDGKYLTNSSPPNAVYTVPLRFSLFKKGLPLCAFREDVSIRIAWNPSIEFTDPPVTNTALFNAHLNIEYTYLSDAEVNFMRKNHIHIFEQVQLAQFITLAPNTKGTFPLQFYNPIKELYFVLQKESARGYNYTNDPGPNYITNGTNLLESLRLDFNNVERIYENVGSPTFLRIVQPLEFHTRLPDRYFYMYSFCLDPEWDSPTGAVNFSRILNQNLTVKLVDGTENVNLRVYARGYNFLNVSDGSAKMVFSNFF